MRFLFHHKDKISWRETRFLVSFLGESDLGSLLPARFNVNFQDLLDSDWLAATQLNRSHGNINLLHIDAAFVQDYL